MSATVQSLRPGKRLPERTPEREALARAIDNHREAEAELNRLRKAQQRAETIVEEAWRTKQQAEVSLKQAEVEEAAHAVAVLLDEADASRSPVRLATTALGRARQQLEDARAARAAVSAPLRKAESRVQLTRMLLSSAVRTAVRTDSATMRLIALYQEALKVAAGLRRALKYLDDQFCFTDRSWAAEGEWPDLPGAAPWQQALAALEIDPDAPLPC